MNVDGLAIRHSFPESKGSEVDGIITMYHDQGQIALKLMGFDRGVTVQGGIPFPVTTPAHGTAFDIAGTGTADVKAMTALLILRVIWSVTGSNRLSPIALKRN